MVMSAAVATRKRAPEREKPIEMSGAMPRWRDDDATFIARRMRMYEEEPEPVGCSRVVRDLGFNDRNDREDGPSLEYMRVRAALRRAVREGLLRQRGKKYALP